MVDRRAKRDPRRIRRPGGLPLAIVTTLVSAPLGCRSPETTPLEAQLSGLQIQLTEHAHDGDHTLRDNDLATVDANSNLVISFRGPKDAEVQPVDPRWIATQRLLEETRRLAQRRAELMAEAAVLDLSDGSAVQAFIEKDQAFASSWLDWNAALNEAAGGPEAAQAIQIPQDVPRSERKGPYYHVAEWLRQQVESIQRDTQKHVEDASKVMVTVEAFHDPIFGDRKALHVRNYDHIPEGRLQPIDRLGLGLTDAENKRLGQELALAGAAKSAIREVQRSNDRIQDSGRALLQRVRDRFDRLLTQLERAPASLRTEGWASLASAASSTTVGNDTGAQKAKERLAIDLAAFQADWAQVLQLEEGVENLRDALRALRVSNLGESASALRSSVEDIVPDATSLLTKVRDEWLGRLQRITVDSVTLTRSGMQAALDETAYTFLADLRSELTETVQALTLLENLFSARSASEARGNELLAGTQTAQIARPRDDLLDGVVDLRRAGLTLGDNLEVRVQLHESIRDDSDQLVPGRVLEEHSFQAEAVLLGLHRRIHGDLIFARADSGSVDAKRWKPNVAAVATWQYRIREPSSGFGHTWNWLMPGFGIHAASLDQGDDSVEVGMGGNVSLWDGLVSAGYGANLNVSQDRGYYFLSLDLVSMLDSARKGASSLSRP